MKMRKKYPVLLAYPRKDGLGLQVWCPFCKRWHLHGWVFGHRVAHCSKESSPFRKTGYILKAATSKIKAAGLAAEARIDREERLYDAKRQALLGQQEHAK